MKKRIWIFGLIAATICLAGWQSQGAGAVGKIVQEDISGDDLSQLSGAYVGKFRYTLPEGNYDVDIWLEQLDADTTEPKRLTFGKGSNDAVSDGGLIWVSLSDPATTTTEKRESWKLVISYADLMDGKQLGGSGSANYLLKNPLIGLPGGEQDGILMSSKLEERAIEVGREVTLMEWAGGPPTESVRGDGYTNFRHVYLKMKIVQHGELFP